MDKFRHPAPKTDNVINFTFTSLIASLLWQAMDTFAVQIKTSSDY